MHRCRTECTPIEGITDHERLPGKVGFQFRRHSGEDEIGPQSSDVVTEQGDRTVGGHQQVQDVEPFGGLVRDEPCLRAGMELDDLPGTNGIPGVTVNQRRAVGPGDGRDGEQPVSGAPGERSSWAGDVDDPIAVHAVRGEAGNR